MRSNRIIAQSFVWNAAQFITAPVLAVHKYVDEIQLFDGAFRFMKDAGYASVPWSTDGTKEVFTALKLECAKKWVPCKDFYKDEIAKKLFMQQRQFWNPGEWKYILSDDEIPSGDLDATFKQVRASNALVGYIRMWEPQRSKQGVLTLKYLGWKPRLLRWQKDLHWKGKHYNLYNAMGIPRDRWPKITLKQICLLHLKHIRPGERLQPQLAYERLNL